MPTLNEADLAHFIGTEHWYRHGINSHITFTDGAKYLADNGGAYWLLDEIAIANMNPAMRSHPFQAWKLVRNKTGNGAKLFCEDGNTNRILSKSIPFTDFPLGEITLWACDGVIMLPSEY